VPVWAATAPTDLHAAVTPTAVVYPGTATVDGVVSVAGAGITLYARPAGASAWSALGATTAGGDGAFRFVVAPSSSTALRLVYAGDAEHAPASIDLQLGLRPLVTISFPADLWLGDSTDLRGAVAPSEPGAAVVIERRLSGEWQPFMAATLDAASGFAVPWQPADRGFYRLRARAVATTQHLDGASRSTRATVNPPNRHDVPYRYAHYIVIVRHEYELYYYEYGVLVRSFDVALGRPGYRTPLGIFKIRAKRRPAGGALGSCAMYYYRTIAIHGTNQPSLLRRFPRAFSHGCARMYNQQALWLYERCPRGTPVRNLR